MRSKGYEKRPNRPSSSPSSALKRDATGILGYPDDLLVADRKPALETQKGTR